MQELARLSRHELAVMPMTQETEVSELMGQWLPSSPSGASNDALKSAVERIKEAGCFILVYIHPGWRERNEPADVQLRERLEDFAARAITCDKRLALSGSPRDEARQLLSTLLDTYNEVRDRLSYHAAHAPDELIVPEDLMDLFFKKHWRPAQQALEALEQQAAPSGEVQESRIQFEFVESPLVRAMQEGGWVLLDNVNSAPPEVTKPLLAIARPEHAHSACHPTPLSIRLKRTTKRYAGDRAAQLAL